ncbi:hypothetical protein N0V90_006519 [Kalmusia sp. IMI 367209]|nr:hypothetical protein N0V90_006519 [Kalmusia sp. IMI 367209]
MDRAEGLPGLDRLWTNGHTKDPCCFVCAQSIGNEVLVRTFRALRKDSTKDRPHCSRVISGGNYDLFLFDRHHRCCTNRTIIAISHVWDRGVSDAHHKGSAATKALQLQVSKIIFDSLERISSGLSSYLEEGLEMWYDYVSVPQWEDDVKIAIMRAIPDIFHNAFFTLVYLHDVGIGAVNLLRYGESTRERIKGITQICNARWFSRVWTTMEFIRSSGVKVMMKEGTLIEDAPQVFIGKMNEVWNEERKNFNTVQDLERFAEIGKNIVPWNLGLLTTAKAQGTVDMAFAFVTLARRGCYSDRDFFHALLGIVKADLMGVNFKENPKEAMLQIAIACMQAGDYSPLLFNPRAAAINEANLPPILKISGHLDVLAFGLGNRHGFPEYQSDSTFSTTGCNIKLECIGKVTFASQMHHLSKKPICRFLQCAMFTLDHTGPDLPQFVQTVAGRIYNFHKLDIDNLLGDFITCRKIQVILNDWYDSTTRFAIIHLEAAQRLADLMGLTRILPNTHRLTTPMGYLDEHGGGIHGYSSASLIAARCPGCHESSVYQVGLHRPPTQVRGSTAYRITGVHYEFAKPDGAGILVKNGVIVGRLLWATRACECRIAETINVRLENLPMRIPRT